MLLRNNDITPSTTRSITSFVSFRLALSHTNLITTPFRQYLFPVVKDVTWMAFAGCALGLLLRPDELVVNTGLYCPPFLRG